MSNSDLGERQNISEAIINTIRMHYQQQMLHEGPRLTSPPKKPRSWASLPCALYLESTVIRKD